MTERDILRVVCETCGAARGKKCRSVKRPRGMPVGMLPMWCNRREVESPHRARRERAAVFADKRRRRCTRRGRHAVCGAICVVAANARRST
jgi:hypothetical protein